MCKHKLCREAFSLTPSMTIRGTQQAGILCNFSYNATFSAELRRTLLVVSTVDSSFYKLRVTCLYSGEGQYAVALT